MGDSYFNEGHSPINKPSQRVRKYKIDESYKLQGVVYSCINAIANSISGVPVVFQIKNTKTIVQAGGIWNLFNPPLKHVIPSMRELIKLTLINMLGDGEVFWPFEFKDLKPVNLNVVRGQSMREVVGMKTNNLIGWVELQKTKSTGGTEKKPYPADQVLQFKLPNPYNKYRGLSPLLPARLDIEQDFNMSFWNAGYFEGGIHHPLAISLKHNLSPAQRKEYRKELREDYSGYINGQNALVLSGGATIAHADSTSKDMDFVEGKGMAREDLCSIFGVLPAIIGIFRYANYANSREQKIIFWNQTNVPIMEYLRDVIQINLLDVYFPDIEMIWDISGVKELQKDQKEKAVADKHKAVTVKEYKELGYTLAQIAVLLDDPLIDPVNINEAIRRQEEENKPPKPPKEEETGNAVGAKVILITEDGPTSPISMWDKDGGWIIKANDSFLHRYAETYESALLDPYTREWEGLFNNFLKQVIDQTIANVKKGGRGVIDPIVWINIWSELSYPLAEKNFERGMLQAVDEINQPSKAISFLEKQYTGQGIKLSLTDFESTLSPEQRDQMKETIKVINSKTIKPIGVALGQLNDVSTKVIMDGGTIQDLRKQLQNKVTELYQGRALTISRTVAGAAYSKGRYIAFEIKGVQLHQWASSGKANVRDTHKKEHGHKAKLGKKFPVTGLRYPLDPMGKAAEVINCVCTTFPSYVKPTGKRPKLVEEKIPVELEDKVLTDLKGNLTKMKKYGSLGTKEAGDLLQQTAKEWMSLVGEITPADLRKVELSETVTKIFKTEKSIAEIKKYILGSLPKQVRAGIKKAIKYDVIPRGVQTDGRSYHGSGTVYMPRKSYNLLKKVLSDKYVEKPFSSNTFDVNDALSAAQHELGHAIDFLKPKFGRSNRKYLFKRAGDSSIKKLFPDYPEYDDEVGFRDIFWSDYVGKVYARESSSEIMSSVNEFWGVLANKHISGGLAKAKSSTHYVGQFKESVLAKDPDTVADTLLRVLDEFGL